MKLIKGLIDSIVNILIGVGMAHVLMHFTGHTELNKVTLIGYFIFLPIIIFIQIKRGLKINKK